MEVNKNFRSLKYSHKDHKVSNANEVFCDRITTGQKVADGIARVVGSWPFIIIQSVILVSWIITNVFLAYQFVTNRIYFNAWDPYPFILLNLVLSFQAAYTGPIVLMSQNRQAAKDRLTAEIDYKVNNKAEEEIRVLMEHLDKQDEHLIKQDEIITKLVPDTECSTRSDNPLIAQMSAVLMKLSTTVGVLQQGSVGHTKQIDDLINTVDDLKSIKDENVGEKNGKTDLTNKSFAIIGLILTAFSVILYCMMVPK